MENQKLDQITPQYILAFNFSKGLVYPTFSFSPVLLY